MSQQEYTRAENTHLYIYICTQVVMSTMKMLFLKMLFKGKEFLFVLGRARVIVVEEESIFFSNKIEIFLALSMAIFIYFFLIGISRIKCKMLKVL